MEVKLAELVSRLHTAAGENLKAVVLYGSAVTGEHHAEHSDLNILCVVNRAGVSELAALNDTAAWWTRQGNHAPLIFTHDELQRAADVFAIEFLDMKQQHRMLFGEDFFAAFEIPLHQHRLQVERELRTASLKLRQAILTGPRTDEARVALMTKAVSTFGTLFRHALTIFGQAMPADKRAAVAEVAAVVGGDPSGFNLALDLREDKRKLEGATVDQALRMYIDLVERVTNEVDRRLDAK